jgi:tetratricopeptide (TPR) repeat protein
MNITEKEAQEKYNEGQKAITKSFFKLKFSADYLEGSEKFTESAKIYKKLKNYPKSIESFNQAIICYKKLNDYFQSGNCYLEISEIYFFELNNIENGLKNLQNASIQYKIGGKNQQAIKLYTDISDKFLNEKKFDISEKILNLCLKECEESADNQLIRISGEGVYTKFLDVLCASKKYSQVIGITENYIKSQLKYEKKDMYKINQMYVKLAILRILNGEDYLVDEIIGRMHQLNYSDTMEDVSDLRKLMDSIKNLNKKNFNFCITATYSLFENNLLKGLQELYKKKEEEFNEGNKNNNDNNNIVGINEKKEDNKIKDNNEINTDSNKEGNNDNKINNNDDFL